MGLAHLCSTEQTLPCITARVYAKEPIESVGTGLIYRYYYIQTGTLKIWSVLGEVPHAGVCLGSDIQDRAGRTQTCVF